MLVSAEAGYGKSTLLNGFALHTSDHCVWYRMETSDGDWITFLSYMVAAFRRVPPTSGGRPRHCCDMSPRWARPERSCIAQFLADLGSLDVGRVAVILDDYHFVEASSDVRMILSRMLERAPDDVYFILGGRGRPNLALGRLLAQGCVSELTIDDLRFTPSEIAELFSTTYRQPLDGNACRVVAAKTEGWAASLQLVSASIAVSRPSEVASFIEALSGAEGPIYDFLAEEVLTRLSERTQRILIHASLIDRVRPELVVAALSVTRDPPDTGAVDRALAEAEALGLMGLRGGTPGGRRIHPLFREFLAVHLEREATDGEIRAMHRAIAITAEANDWLVASKHFATAGEPHEAMRVLGSAAGEALGAGAWGAAVEVVDLMPDTPPPPAVKVIQARALVSEGYPDEALASGVSNGVTSKPMIRALVSLARASALQAGGRGAELWREVDRFRATHHSDPVVNRLAEAWSLIGGAFRGGSIQGARESLTRLAHESERRTSATSRA